jgi:hypothetical protein
VNTLEDRIRSAARAAADALADGSAPPLDLSRAGHLPLRSWRRPGRGRLRRTLVPLTAAVAVVLVAGAAIAIPRSLDSGLRHPAAGASTPAVSPTPTSVPGGQDTVLPGYLATQQLLGTPALDIRNAVTGTLTATLGLPLGYSWYAVAGQGPRTFIASKTLNNMGPTTSRFYRIAISDLGKVTSIRQVGPAAPGTVFALSVTPDGRYIGYVLSISYGAAGQDARDEVVLANLTTGKVIASWPIPDIDYVCSMSIDSGGNALAIGAYYYHYNGLGTINTVKQDLTQWTSVLRPATSGTPIDKVPRLLPQAAPLALSPDGATLYEFLQAGRVPSKPQQDRAPVTFDLAAVNASTGTVVAVLHTWRAPWPNFAPQLALSPGGGYLLITDGVSLARVRLATGQYTALPGTVPELGPLVSAGKLQPGQGGDSANPLAW